MTVSGEHAPNAVVQDATDSVPGAEPPRRAAIRSVWLPTLAIALLACLLSLLRFSPPFEKWMTYDYMIGRHFAETFRAHSIEKQLADPFGFVPAMPDRVVAWRLLPVLPAHYLGASFGSLLAFAWVGAFALVWYCSTRLAATSRWWERLGLAVLVATSSVFFVSTEWLAYFDAWWILALCVVSFSPSTAAVVVSALLGPWIDERFIVGLPVAFASRCLLGNYSVRECRRAILQLGLAVAPYAALRLLFWSGSLNEAPADYLSGRSISIMWKNPLGLGTWEAFRAGWLLLPVLVPFIIPGRASRLALLIAASIASLGVSFYLADDVSRSASILLPSFVAVVVVAQQQLGRKLGWALLGAAAFNLTLPAFHVIRWKQDNIPTLYRAMDRLQTWREDSLVSAGNQIAVDLMTRDDFEGAFWLLSDANREDPLNVVVLHNLARAADRSDRMEMAVWAYRRLIDENPTDPGPMLHLGLLCERLGDADAARNWAAAALKHSTSDQRLTQEANQLLRRLDGKEDATPDEK